MLDIIIKVENKIPKIDLSPVLFTSDEETVNSVRTGGFGSTG